MDARRVYPRGYEYGQHDKLQNLMSGMRNAKKDLNGSKNLKSPQVEFSLHLIMNH
jgi:hypothetical protein